MLHVQLQISQACSLYLWWTWSDQQYDALHLIIYDKCVKNLLSKSCWSTVSLLNCTCRLNFLLVSQWSQTSIPLSISSYIQWHPEEFTLTDRLILLMNILAGPILQHPPFVLPSFGSPSRERLQCALSVQIFPFMCRYMSCCYYCISSMLASLWYVWVEEIVIVNSWMCFDRR